MSAKSLKAPKRSSTEHLVTENVTERAIGGFREEARASLNGVGRYRFQVYGFSPSSTEL